MIKPASLRDAIIGANKYLAKSADSLHIFVEKGTLAATLAGANPGMCYHYTCTILITDHKGHPDSIFAPVLEWCRTNQPDLLLDQSKDAIEFEVDLLGEKTYDIEIRLPLTERVRLRIVEGKPVAEHLPAPTYDTIPAGIDWSLTWPDEVLP